MLTYQTTTSAHHIESHLPIRPKWDWISFFFAWALLLTVTRRLLVTQWTEDLYLVGYIVNIAYFLGLALGYSKFKYRTIAIFSLAYGCFFIGWRLGLLQSSESPWSEKLSAIFIRLSIIFQRLADNQPVYDSLFFLLLMMTLFWILGFNTGLSLLRTKSALRMIAPLVLTLFVIHSYDPLIRSRSGYLYLFSIVSLLLISRFFYLHQHEGWAKKQFYIPPQLSTETIQFNLWFVIGLLMISILIPSSRSQLDSLVRVWEKVKEPFKAIREDFENAFSSLRVTTQIQPELFERTLNLGRGNELTEQEIFTAIAQTKIPEGVRIFWRSRLYDSYENGQWTINQFSSREFQVNSFDLKLPSFANRSSRLHTFTIYLNQPLATLVLPAQPHWINLAVQIEYVENSDGTNDLLAVRSPSPLAVGKTFSVRSSLTSITVEQLEEASEDYPDWVTARYLQLPPNLTERTKALAMEITKDASTPYEKVLAITDYLRNNMTYVETLEELPTNQEPIDWFLFDYKKGFCNYYATAAVLLLRIVGIPARLAVGYAEGTMEDIQSANVYVVRQRDAHAWPEVFFPNLGWIEFEPTSSQPELQHPRQKEDQEAEQQPSEQQINPQEILSQIQREKEHLETETPRSQRSIPLIPIFLFLIVIIITVSLWKGFNVKIDLLVSQQLPEILERQIRALGFTPPKVLIQWNLRSKLLPFEKAYQTINTALRILRHPPPSHYTPLERAAYLQELLPEAHTEIKGLLQNYQEMLYGKASLAAIQGNNSEIKLLRLAWKKRFRTDLQRLFNH